MQKAVYNEFDPQAAAWIRELIRENLVTRGEVDERSIKDVAATDLRGFGRAHFFSGIAGWELALQLAGWPADRPVWTGSCPCQPYSSAGKQRGNADERDLWPDFFRLIRECRPQCVFGEQVEAAIRHGWLDRVCADLEGEGYTVGAAVLGAHSAGAPHIRQRLYWVASLRLVSPDVRGQHEHLPVGEGAGRGVATSAERAGGTDGVGFAPLIGDGPYADGRGVGAGEGTGRQRGGGGSGSSAGVALGDASGTGREGDAEGRVQRGESAEAGFWGGSYFIACRDGKARRVPLEPALFPLAHGVPGRVGMLRGAGNAIVPQTAAAFIRAFLEAEGRVVTS